MRAVIHTCSASVEILAGSAPSLDLTVVAHDHADEDQRTRVRASLDLDDLVMLHAVVGAHLKTQGVQP